MNKLLKRSAVALLAVASFLAGCGGGGGGAGRPVQEPVPQPVAGPHLAAFKPISGSPGDPVLITGSGLANARGVWFGDVPAERFHAVGDQRLYAIVPPGAGDGRIRVANQAGPAAFGSAFSVRHPKPRLIMFSPHVGQAGTEVLLTGTSFTPDLKVWFGHVPAPEVTVHSLTQATVKVPAGLHHDGGLRLATAAGSFGPQGAGFHAGRAPALSVAGVMITQGSQTPEMDVPLVAGRDAFCMVALQAGGPHQQPPRVRVRIADHGDREIFTQVIQPPAGLGEVPMAVDPANLGSLWSVAIPGQYLREHSWLRVDVLSASDPASAAPIATWPGTLPVRGVVDNGAWMMDVRTVPTLEVTLVPIVVDGLTGNVDAPPRRLEDWVGRFKAMFPVAEVVVRKGNPLHWNGTLRPGPEDYFADLEAILERLEQQRLQDGKRANQFYYGVVQNRSELGFGGVGLFPTGVANQNRCAIGGDWEGSFPEDNRRFDFVFTHEMGHVLGCEHADSHPPDFPLQLVDAGFPYPKADIGAFGFDVAARAIKAPGSYKDVMSYTPPLWVSDYHYRKILNFLHWLRP